MHIPTIYNIYRLQNIYIIHNIKVHIFIFFSLCLYVCMCIYMYISAVTIRDGFNNPLKVVAYVIRWLNGRLDVSSLICSIGRII